MKTTRLSTLILITLLLSLPAAAQSWRWAISGGSSNNSTLDVHREGVWDMVTDRNGNVYTISTIGNKDINAAGQFNQFWVPQTFTYSREVMINSFTCSGVLRWSKLIGCEIGHDFGYALRTDSADGVYAALDLGSTSSPAVVHIDADTVLTGTSFKTLYVLKYDTAGNYQWLTGAQEDTIGFYTQMKSYWRDMHVDGQGNVYCFMRLPAGIYGGSYTATTAGDYMLRYNKNGAFVEGIKLETVSDGTGLQYAHFTRDASTGRYYIAGMGSSKFYVGSDSVNHGMYLIAFDKDGKYIWKKENKDMANSGFLRRPLLDREGYIYLCGFSSYGDVFNGFSFSNVSPPMPFVVKMDSSGNNLWMRAAMINNTVGVGGIAFRNSGEIDLVTKSQYMYWPGFADTVDYLRDRPVITRFNVHTGKVLGMDTTSTISWVPDLAAYPSAITGAAGNSVYVGGGFSNMLVIGSTTLVSGGGEDDFFVTRWGYDSCSCDSIPEPSFSSTNAGHTFQFTYTGTQPFQSILWDFGDGTTSTQLNPVHTFSPVAKFGVTVTVTNDCGDNTFGGMIQTVGVEELSTSQISIYPNPAINELTIEGATAGSTVLIFDISGRLYSREEITGTRSSINTASLPGGQYILKLSEPGKTGYLHRFVKQ